MERAYHWSLSFSLKALNAANAGAIAIVIINEYPGAGPFAPGSSTGVLPVTIPVIMISNEDGIAISAQYHSSPAGTVRMSLVPWGQGNQHDLGMVNNGQALWHNFALPYYQFAGENTKWAYKGLDGTFIANFGSSPATGVKVAAATSFTPSSSGVPTVQHRDTVSFAGPFTGTGADPLHDSIYAMFGSEYDLSASGPGRFDVTYQVYSDSSEQSPSDNSVTKSFYLSDSVYSKGRYNFVTKAPIRDEYFGFSGGAVLLSESFHQGLHD